jgi:hypothetical protein
MARPETVTLQSAAPDAGFMGCPSCGADEFAVVCHGVPDRPHIVALVCVECDTEIAVDHLTPRAMARN